jgi:hypothetical protein
MASDEALVQHVWSVQQIEQLAYRYALGVDSRNLDALVALFTPGVEVGMDGRERDPGRGDLRHGRDALREWFAQSLRSFGASFLSVTNHIIDFQGDDAATGIVYCRAEMEVGDQWIVQAIQYWDDYVRHEGKWYFAYRRHLMLYSLEMHESPVGQRPVRFPVTQTGLGALPDAHPSWARFWTIDASGKH